MNRKYFFISIVAGLAVVLLLVAVVVTFRYGPGRAIYLQNLARESPDLARSELIEMLNSESKVERSVAMNSLARMGQRAMPDLIRALKSDRPRIRLGAVVSIEISISKMVKKSVGRAMRKYRAKQ